MIRRDVIYQRIAASELKISDRELAARLGGIFSDKQLLDEMKSSVLAAASPAYAAVHVAISYEGDDTVLADGIKIKSRDLVKNLAGARRAIFMAVTLGAGVDILLKRLGATSETKRFIGDATASATAESLCDLAAGQLCKGLVCRRRFSPGYGDLPLTLQPLLLDRVSADNLLGIKLSDSYLMIPSKSITCIIGVEK